MRNDNVKGYCMPYQLSGTGAYISWYAMRCTRTVEDYSVRIYRPRSSTSTRVSTIIANPP